MITVYIVICPDLGWDCIVGVFDANKVGYNSVSKQFPEKDGYVIFERTALRDVEQD